MELARTAVKLKDYQGALGYLAHARSLEPANATVHFFFGMVCVEQNLGREAYESMKKAVELDPDNPLVNYAMGAVATHRHEPSESLPYFEKYVRLKPDDPRGHFALGAARFYSNQFEEARPELERAARAPETATGAHYFLGAHRAAGQRSRDRPSRDRARPCGSTPELADAWAELGLIQTRSNEYATAGAVARQGAGDRPGTLRGVGEPGDALRQDEGSTPGGTGGQGRRADREARSAGAGVSADHQGGAV